MDLQIKKSMTSIQDYSHIADPLTKAASASIPSIDGSLVVSTHAGLAFFTSLYTKPSILTLYEEYTGCNYSQSKTFC